MKEYGRVRYCVNALERATLISTRMTLTMVAFVLLCQCPRTGNTHFYQIATKKILKDDKCVNALERATLISTRQKTQRRGHNIRVNALERATLISTVPPQEPL